MSFHHRALVSLVALALCSCSCPADPRARRLEEGLELASSVPRTEGPCSVASSSAIPQSRHILVDQFGYRPADSKVAVINDPQVGFNFADSFTPGPRYELRRWADAAPVFSGTPAAWNQGERELSSGDRGWWFDFSSVDAPGCYYVYDVERNARSAAFEIGERVYRGVLKAATRMFFYNRCGFAKRTPFAETCWTDEAAYLGPRQDQEARSVKSQGDATTALDVSGGWFDAGDTNKYVTFASPPVHQLLTAYQNNPSIWTDDFNIPESGNGIPDVLDEVKWEIDWLRKMQRPGGEVLLKVGTLKDSPLTPPSRDRLPRYYIPSCSSSTIAAAAMFAHAALVFAEFDSLAGDAVDLKARAGRAFDHYRKNPKRDDCDDGAVRSGDADRPLKLQEQLATVAAIYLFAATGEERYGDLVKASYRTLRPYEDAANGAPDPAWTRYDAEQGEALLFYAALPNADPAVAEAIRARKVSDSRADAETYGFHAGQDLYRAFMPARAFHWGSNQPRADTGNSNMDLAQYKLVSDAAPYRARALEILHYFHGVNPLGMAFLTNMRRYGASRSANAIFHAWFRPGSKWSNALTSECGPAPGYVPGGPNSAYSGRLAPPAGQPPQKSYRDWNVGYPENSWEITEPGIYYQASYVKLLSTAVR